VVRPRTTPSTGARVSHILIVEYMVAGLYTRPVNSGVMSALLVNSTLIATAPQLNNVWLVWIIREAG
jgi:hypothetical protein